MNTINDAIPQLDRAGLRKFGYTFGVLVAVLFGTLIPWLLGTSSARWPTWPWVVLLVFGAWASFAPETLRPVYVLWMRFGLMMSRITTPLIMGLVFFVLITPIALVFRIFGRDAMARRIDPKIKTYRIVSTKASPDSLRHPY
jgi:hypothetical protein